MKRLLVLLLFASELGAPSALALDPAIAPAVVHAAAAPDETIPSDEELAEEEEETVLNGEARPANSAEAKATAQGQGPVKSYLRTRAPKSEQSADSKGSEAPRIFAAFALLAALGAIAAYVRRRRLPPELRGNQVRLALISRLGLTPKAQLALVSVGKEALLIGVTESGITTLRTFTVDEVPSLTLEAAEKVVLAESSPASADPELRAPSAAFQSLLEKASGKKAANDVVRPALGPVRPEPEDEVPDHLRRALEASGLSGHGFDAPEGQAKELAQRFKGLRS